MGNNMKKYVIIGLTLYWVALIFMHTNAGANEQLTKDTGVKLAKVYLEDHIKQYIDFNNKNLKRGIGVSHALYKQEIGLSLTDNIELFADNNNFMIKFTKEF